MTATVQVAKPGKTYNSAIGYLRAFAVVLVLAHHAVSQITPLRHPPGRSLLIEPR